MQMPGRKYQASPTSKYRYSINGQEKESDLNENITTALYWEYDSRIVRRWNIDPEGSENESPYLCFNGNPIQMADPDGNKPTDIIYRNTAGKEIARQKTKDNFDQYITVLQGTVTIDGNGGQSGSADLKTRFDKVVYHNRNQQPATPPTPPTAKKAPSQAPVNTKQQPAANNETAVDKPKVETEGGYKYSTPAIVSTPLDVVDATGAAAENTLNTMGKYLPKAERFKWKAPSQLSGKTITPLGNVVTTAPKVLKAARILGKVAAVANVAMALTEIGADISQGKYVRAAVRTGVNAAIMATNAIPGVGWMISIGLGYLEAKYGDDLYKHF